MRRIISILICMNFVFSFVQVRGSEHIEIEADDVQKVSIVNVPSFPESHGETTKFDYICYVIDLLNSLELIADDTDMSGTGGSAKVLTVLYKDGKEETYTLYGNHFYTGSGQYILNAESAEKFRRIGYVLNGSIDISTNDTETNSLLQALPTAAFSDLGGYEWCEDDVTYLSERELLLGTSDETFSPAAAVKRGDFAVLAVRVFGLGAEGISENFDDVTPDMYFYQSVGILKLYQVVSGIDRNHYCPDNNILRQDMAVLLWRLMNKMGYYGNNDTDTILSTYSDEEKIGAYARDAVAYMIDKGIMTGKSDEQLCPLDTVTRAEMAVMMARIHRFLEQSYGN